MSYLVDTHAHLNDSKFAEDLPEVIDRAQDGGVERIVVCGYDIDSSRAAVELSERFEEVYATVGVHPHDAKTFTDESLQVIAELSARPKVLAIGEIGLDFHYDLSPRPQQVAVFEMQIELAGALGMPIVVHSREAHPEVQQVLTKHAANIIRCVIHCFQGDEDTARQILDAGFYIGVDGPVTYKASEKLRRVIAVCPDDRLLVETDCPYLAPIPKRGKRNEPAYVRYVAEEVARVKGLTLDAVAEITTRNAHTFFGEKFK